MKRYAKSVLCSIFFFFSSRRRHTRFDCDWSSDVCSSDLRCNSTTFWHTQWGGRVAPPPPHDIVVDLGRVYQVSAFAYLPRQDGQDNGTIARYEFAVSVDGPPWPAPVATGPWSANTQLKTVEFPAQSGRFVRLTALSEINGHAWTSVAELQVFGTAAAD